MASEYYTNDESSYVPRYLREAIGIVAAAMHGEGKEQAASDEILALPEGERHSQTLVDKASFELHEVSERTRDILLTNLGLNPTDRDTLHEEIFYYSNYNTLQERLKELTRDVFGGIHHVNPELRKEISEALRSKAGMDMPILNDITTGMALGIEAYRIDTNCDLTVGFANLDKAAEAAIVEALNSLIPSLQDDKYCFTPPLIDEVAITSKEGLCRDLVGDISLIGRLTVQRTPLAMRSGAEATLTALQTVWPQLYNPELPAYQRSRYSHDGF